MKWSKLSVVLALATLCTTESHSYPRELKLSCPPDGYNDDATEQELIEGRFDAFSAGYIGVDLVSKLRPKPRSFYQNIVNQVIMFTCDVDVAAERCVDEDSPFAAKDGAGNCINAADFACPSGMCERSSNCYWNSVVEGQNRTNRFPSDDYADAESELIGEMGDISSQFNSYAGGIGIFGVVGAAISLLLLLLWIVFFIARYFCCCLWTQGFCFLCSPIPKDEYRFFQDILLPVVFYLIAGAGIAVATSMAFIGELRKVPCLCITVFHSISLFVANARKRGYQRSDF
jgi:hypothetical protein